MKQIILAGGTGDLGSRVARALSSQKIPTRALVREGSSPAAEAELRGLGHAVERVDFGDAASLKKACRDGTCVISCLSGNGAAARGGWGGRSPLYSFRFFHRDSLRSGRI
jgi:uncharacterized protein YbjT (DUF2867 family)